MSLDDQNRSTWSDPHAIKDYSRAEGFSDEGERVVYEAVREQVRGTPILDLGVGGGRTIPLLRPLASEYVAIDYTPELVRAARARFPDVTIEQGDARDLSRFSDRRFGLVNFSFNGIDCVARPGRLQVLKEAYRVLRPGGVLWFSTLNEDGFGHRMRPWDLDLPHVDRGARQFATGLLRILAFTPRRLWNFYNARSHFEKGDGYSLGPLSSHDYQLVVHYTTLSRLLQDLTSAGFTGEVTIYESGHGSPVRLGDDVSSVFWFHVVVKRPA
jgi:SAM-dependent methyltransferase